MTGGTAEGVNLAVSPKDRRAVHRCHVQRLADDLPDVVDRLRLCPFPVRQRGKLDRFLRHPNHRMLTMPEEAARAGDLPGVIDDCSVGIRHARSGSWPGGKRVSCGLICGWDGADAHLVQ